MNKVPEVKKTFWSNLSNFKRDLIIECGGVELFLEFDSLFYHIISNSSMDTTVGFSILHAVYLLENFIYQLRERDLKFEIVLFKDGECIWENNVLRFIRKVLIEHLKSLSNTKMVIPIHVLDSPKDLDYFLDQENPLVFLLGNDVKEEKFLTKTNFFEFCVNKIINRSGTNLVTYNTIIFSPTSLEGLVYNNWKIERNIEKLEIPQYFKQSAPQIEFLKESPSHLSLLLASILALLKDSKDLEKDFLLSQLLLQSRKLQNSLELKERSIEITHFKEDEPLSTIKQFLFRIFSLSYQLFDNVKFEKEFLDYIDCRLFYQVVAEYCLKKFKLQNILYEDYFKVNGISNETMKKSIDNVLVDELTPIDENKKEQTRKMVNINHFIVKELSLKSEEKAYEFDETFENENHSLLFKEKYQWSIEKKLEEEGDKKLKLTRYDLKNIEKTSKLLDAYGKSFNDVNERETIVIDTEQKIKKKVKKQNKKSAKGEQLKIENSMKINIESLTEIIETFELLKENKTLSFSMRMEEIGNVMRELIDLYTKEDLGVEYFILHSLTRRINFLLTEYDNKSTSPREKEKNRWRVFEYSCFCLEMIKVIQSKEKEKENEGKMDNQAQSKKGKKKKKSKKKKVQKKGANTKKMEKIIRDFNSKIDLDKIQILIEKILERVNITNENQVVYQLSNAEKYRLNEDVKEIQDIKDYWNKEDFLKYKKPFPNGFIPDEWQKRLMRCIDNDESAVVSCPTSSGKTFLTFHLMRKILKRNDDDIVVYVAPTLALVNQICAEVKSRFSKQSYKDTDKTVAGIFLSKQRFKPFNCQILITVPHCLHILFLSPLQSNIEWKKKIKYVIFDEVHNITESDGYTWEQLLQIIQCPFLALSATIGNPNKFCDWLNENKKVRELKFEKSKDLYEEYQENREHPILELDSESRNNTIIKREVEQMKEMNLTECVQVHDVLCALDCFDIEKPKKESELYTNVEEYNMFLKKKMMELIKIDITKYQKVLRELKPEVHLITSQERPVNLIYECFDSEKGEFHEIHPISMLNSKTNNKKILMKEIDNTKEMTGNQCLELYNLLLKYDEKIHASEKCPNVFFSDQINTIISKSKIREYEKYLLEKLKQLLELDIDACKDIINTLNKSKSDEGKQLKDFLVRDTSESFKDFPKIVEGMRKEELLPLLVFHFSRIGVEKLAKILMDYLEENNDNLYDPNDPRVDVEELLDKSDQEEFDKIDDYLLDLLELGIGVHHGGISNLYRMEVEKSFRNKSLKVIIATGTLASGINMPAKSVLIYSDSMFLTPTLFNQVSGRAGRRGYDCIGHVVISGINYERVKRLLVRGNLNLLGKLGITASLVLRIMIYLQQEEFIDDVRNMLKRPLFCINKNDPKEVELLVKSQFRFALEFLVRNNYITKEGKPCGFAGLASHIFYTEPSNYIFCYFLANELFHKIFYDVKEGDNIDELERKVMKVLCFLFTNLKVSKNQRKEDDKTLSVKDMPPEFLEYISKYKDQLTETLKSYLNSLGTILKEEVPELPYSKTIFNSKQGETNCQKLKDLIQEKQQELSTCSVFAGVSGSCDAKFEEVHTIVDCLRKDIHFNETIVPIPQSFSKYKVSKVVYDFYYSTSNTTLLAENYDITTQDLEQRLMDFGKILSRISNGFKKMGSIQNDLIVKVLMDVSNKYFKRLFPPRKKTRRQKAIKNVMRDFSASVGDIKDTNVSSKVLDKFSLGNTKEKKEFVKKEKKGKKRGKQKMSRFKKKRKLVEDDDDF